MPRAIRVGALVYQVLHSHEAVQEYTRSNGIDVYGVFQPRLGRVVIECGYPRSREAKALLHEVVHAIHEGFDLDALKAGEEHYIQVFTDALLDTLQRNPDLVAYLTEAPSA